MKTILALLALLCASQSLLATTQVVTLVNQPINLGARADPSRIPLGTVVADTNHGFSRHRPITAPRPCTHGILKYPKGIELNMNLASAFGINVRADDCLPRFTDVIIEVKDWPIPAYSPYRKDQVVTALIHCLLRTVPPMRTEPLRIRIRAENPDEARSLEKFSVNYRSAADLPVESHLHSDARNVTWVVFSDAKAPSAEALRRPPPVVVPTCLSDESDHAGGRFYLVPVWAGDDWNDPTSLFVQPITLYHDLFDRANTGSPDINYLTESQLFWGTELRERGGEYHLRLNTRVSKDAPPKNVSHALCAILFAAVLTTQPTEQKPLNVYLSVNPDWLDSLEAFTSDPNWTDLRGRLVWDPTTRKITSGSIPQGRLRRDRASIDFSDPSYGRRSIEVTSDTSP